MTHICVNIVTTIGSDNGLSTGRRQAIIWNNVGILLIGLLGTNFSENQIEIRTFSFKKMRLKMSSGKWRPFCLGLNVLMIGARSSLTTNRLALAISDNRKLWYVCRYARSLIFSYDISFYVLYLKQICISPGIKWTECSPTIGTGCSCFSLILNSLVSLRASSQSAGGCVCDEQVQNLSHQRKISLLHFNLKSLFCASTQSRLNDGRWPSTWWQSTHH